MHHLPPCRSSSGSHTARRHQGPAFSYWTKPSVSADISSGNTAGPGSWEFCSPWWVQPSGTLGRIPELDRIYGWVTACRWGVANRKSLNCLQNLDSPVETWLTFRMRWVSFLVWTLAYLDSNVAPFWILLGWCHIPDPLSDWLAEQWVKNEQLSIAPVSPLPSPSTPSALLWRPPTSTRAVIRFQG